MSIDNLSASFGQWNNAYKTKIADKLGLEAKDLVWKTSYRTECGEQLDVALKLNKSTLAGFQLTRLPHSGIVHFSNVSTSPAYRNKGVGGLMYDLRVLTARTAGCRAALCTTHWDNDIEIKFLIRRAWKMIGRYTDAWTGNSCLMWTTEL